jgi:N-acetylglutamate synthase-like GNAT family acetyltransferase
MNAHTAFPARDPERFTPPGPTDRDDAIDLRRAVEADQPAITALVRAERLNPTDLDWRRFLVATHGPVIVAVGQIRRHPDFSREVASVVVDPRYRGRGLATRLLTALLAASPGDHYLVTGQSLAPYFEGLGFRRLPVLRAPRFIRRSYWLGQLGGALISCCNRRKPRRLVVMCRGVEAGG